MKKLNAKMTRDIDPKNAETKDLIAWYNENSGSKPIAKFKDRETAERRVSELKQAIVELSGASSKGDSAKKEAKKAAKAKKADGNTDTDDKSRGRKSANLGKRIYKQYVDPETKKAANPRREGTHGHKSYELIKDGMSYEDYIAAGGRNNDLRYDLDHGFVVLKDK